MCHGKSCGFMGMVANTLLLVGGVNWGLVGVGMLMGSDWNVVHMLLGSWVTVEAVVYVLVGVSGVVKLFGCCHKSGDCKDGSCGSEGMEKSM